MGRLRAMSGSSPWRKLVGERRLVDDKYESPLGHDIGPLLRGRKLRAGLKRSSSESLAEMLEALSPSNHLVPSLLACPLLVKPFFRILRTELKGLVSDGVEMLGFHILPFLCPKPERSLPFPTLRVKLTSCK